MKDRQETATKIMKKINEIEFTSQEDFTKEITKLLECAYASGYTQCELDVDNKNTHQDRINRMS